jgi:hypothetical protein
VSVSARLVRDDGSQRSARSPWGRTGGVGVGTGKGWAGLTRRLPLVRTLRRHGGMKCRHGIDGRGPGRGKEEPRKARSPTVQVGGGGTVGVYGQPRQPSIII